MTTTKIKRTFLSKAQDFQLAKFLHDRTYKPGETYAQIAQEANAALGVDVIKATHIDFRMGEFGLSLIPGNGKVDDDRIARLETRVATLEMQVAMLNAQIGRLQCGQL